MPCFRSVLVHEYIDIDLADVYRVLTGNLEDFEEFAYYVHAYLSKAARQVCQT